MSFRLLIECTKDIDTLKLNFSDGTCVAQEVKHSSSSENQDIPDSGTSNKSASINQESALLDLDVDYTQISQEIIELPSVAGIDSTNRTVNVADELQNLDI